MCHKLVNYDDPVPDLNMVNYPWLRTAYRDFGKNASFQCCLHASGTIGQITISRDGSRDNFAPDADNACHYTDGVKTAEYLHYGIVGSSYAPSDFILQAQDGSYLSICGSYSSSQSKNIELYSQAEDGYLLDFLSVGANPVNFLGLIGDRCQVTPEFF